MQMLGSILLGLTLVTGPIYGHALASEGHGHSGHGQGHSQHGNGHGYGHSNHGEGEGGHGGHHGHHGHGDGGESPSPPAPAPQSNGHHMGASPIEKSCFLGRAMLTPEGVICYIRPSLNTKG